VCLVRFIESLLDPSGVHRDSHSTWIRIWGAGQQLLEATAESVLFADSGDSGALVIADDEAGSKSRRAVGLLVSSTMGHKGFVQPLSVSLEALGVQLVPQPRSVSW
jgi:hypothetical protein